MFANHASLQFEAAHKLSVPLPSSSSCILSVCAHNCTWARGRTPEMTAVSWWAAAARQSDDIRRVPLLHRLFSRPMGTRFFYRAVGCDCTKPRSGRGILQVRCGKEGQREWFESRQQIGCHARISPCKILQSGHSCSPMRSARSSGFFRPANTILVPAAILW